MNSSRRLFLSGLAGLALASCSGAAAPPPTPKPKLRARWSAFTRGSREFVDHRPWNTLLARHVFARSDGVHLFAYGDLSVGERATLDAYITTLSNTAVAQLDRREQYAFWLNLYNALVVRLILSRYLVLSIRDIGFGIGPIGDGPFERKLVSVRGDPLSLSDIRNLILRPIFDDPRLHYGLCDGAVGSPNLARRAYTGDRVDRMLDAAALEFVNHPRGVRREGPRLVLSGLYEWYGGDFGGGGDGPLPHLRQYAAPGLRPDLRGELARRYAFDWSLNDGTGMRQ